jgi:rubrerythrin
VDDPFATPWLAVVALLAIPLVVSAFLGAMTFRRLTRLVYRCRRCDRDFQRAAHRAFPATCPLCDARDWNS